MFSTPSYGEWTKVSISATNKTTFYVDFERIRKQGGIIYYWILSDFLKPKHGDWSSKIYVQGDCNLFREKILNASYHKKPMGEGPPSMLSSEPDKNWHYPPPNTSMELILKEVCNH